MKEEIILFFLQLIYFAIGFMYGWKKDYNMALFCWCLILIVWIVVMLNSRRKNEKEKNN